MIDFAIGAVVGLILAAAIFYVIRAKKRGQKCIGCPQSGACGGKCAEKKKKKKKKN